MSEDVQKSYYVLYSEQKGVYIDGNDWSYADRENWALDRVRTFEGSSVKEAMDWFRTNQGVSDVRAVEVIPDCKFALASLDALTAAGLPTWEYDRDRVERERKPKV